MKRLVALLVAVLLAGCAHTGVAINSSGAAAAGTTTVSGSVAASGSGAAAFVLFAIAAVAIHSTELISPPPELDDRRRVNEQDCSKPIKDWSANLKCK